MKKSFAIALIVSLSVILSAGFVMAMDADELIKKSFEATGGLDKIKSVKSSHATGKALAQGMEFPFVMRTLRPNYLRLDVEIMGMTMIQAFDGEKGWTINPMAGITVAQDMTEIENKSFKLQANMDGLLVDYKDKGYTVEYIGEADVEGTPAYQLKVDTHDDIVMDLFFDQEYFLNIKMTTAITWEEKVNESETYMSDFQEIEGMIMPFSIETRMGGVAASQIVIEKVELDTEFEEGLFEMPAAEAAPATTK